MKAVYVKEQRRYTRKELSSLLGVIDEKVVSTIRRLKEFGILKTVRSSSAQREMSDLLEEDIVISDVESGREQYYVFTFVGLVIVGEFVLKCYPKYLQEDSELPRNLAQILRVLERYNAREQVVPMFNDTMTESRFNLLAVMLFLLRDYFEHGSYTNSHETLETNGTGEVNWDRTINDTFALISQGRPHYMELKTRRRLDDDGDFFRRLHESVLTQFTQELRDADLLTLLELPGVDIDGEPVESLGDTDYLLYRIEGELSTQFNTRKQTVLKALYAYLAKRVTIGEPDGFSAFGSSSFNLVWESVCSTVFGNQLNVPISTLPLPVPIHGKYDANATLLSLIDKPEWSGRDEKGEFSQSSDRTLTPDLVTIHVSDGRHRLVVLDAKYYRIRLHRDMKITGQPGIGDLTKQYLYQLAFQEFIDNHGIHEVRNCFLLPTGNQVVQSVGHVSLGMLSHLGLESIQLRLLPASEMYDRYLREKRMNVAVLAL